MEPGEVDARLGGHLDAAAASLREWLCAEEFVDLGTTQVTAHLTGSITRWASDLGYAVSHEVKLPADAPRRPIRNGSLRGRLDVRARHPTGRSAISIEIDRGDKTWSLKKLTYAAGQGDLALWVRWGIRDSAATAPEDVRILNLRTSRRKPQGGQYLHSLSRDRCD